MGLIQPYRGNYIKADSAVKQLDAVSILEGCDAVEEEARSIGTVAYKLADAASPLDEKTFLINEETVLPMVDQYCEEIHRVELEITNVVSQIRDIVEGQYNRIQEDLNYDAEERERVERNRREGGNS